MATDPEGAVFRSVTKATTINDRPVSGATVHAVLVRRLAAAGVDPAGYSGHSLRAGFVTDAYTAVGKYKEAEQLLLPAAADNPLSDAALELGLLQRLQGRRTESMRTFTLLLSREYVNASLAEYVRAGRAARAIGRFEQANGYFRDAIALAPTDVVANTEWGALFLEKHNRTDAAKSFQAALRTNAESPAALLGLARTMADDNPPLARKLAQQVLGINPNEAGAHVLLADMALDDLKRAEATAEVEKALAVNPNHFEALALKAAIAWLEKRPADQTAATDALLKLNPTYGEVHRVIGGVSARNYRFDEAAEFARKAVWEMPLA